MAGSCIFWTHKFIERPDASVKSISTGVPTVQIDGLLLSEFLGSRKADKPQSAIVSISSRFVLQGVLAENSGAGAALIAVDGKLAKPFRVGSEVIAGYTLESVKSRVATLKSSTDNSGKVVLEMAPLKK